MLWLVVTSYRRNRKKFNYVILSLILTTFLATISISSLEFAASVWKRPFLMLYGGHIVLWQSESDAGIMPVHPSKVFDGEKASKIVKEVFPEASTTAQLIVPATYINESGATHILTRLSHLVGRSDNLDVWYLGLEARGGRPLSSIAPDEPAIVCLDPYPAGLPDATIRIAKYAGGERPWQMKDAEARTLKVAGRTMSGSGDYKAYMRIEALRNVTGCPSNMVSFLGVAFRGMQYTVPRARLEELRARLAQEMPGMMAITAEELVEKVIANSGVLIHAPRKYLPIIYSISFMVVAAIVASIAYSRRRELRMLHIIGSSRNQVRFLFATECVIASALAGLLGFLPLWLLGRFVLGTDQISLLPLVVTLSGTGLIAVLTSALLLDESASEGVSMW